MSLPTTFRALRVTEQADQTFARTVTDCALANLPDHDVLVRVAYAALNYKDALSATGNRGVTRHYPHTPGIDAAGTVVESRDPRFAEGDAVVVTSYDLGMNTPGGFAEYVRVPGDWIVPLPAALDLRTSMVIGTAGFTAGLALWRMEQAGQHPDQGPVLVTGATGGVGSLAVGILARAGYEVMAATGKADAHDYLRQLGASRIVGRADVRNESSKPLLRPEWAGAIDTVGGLTLSTALRGCRPHGHVAACGLVESPQLSLTVFPFIIQGVSLLGIDSATCPMPLRQQVWQRLATDWRVPGLDSVAQEVTLDELSPYMDQILASQVKGRVVVRP